MLVRSQQHTAVLLNTPEMGGHPAPLKSQPRFGNAAFASTLFRTLEANPIAELLFIDVFGLNFPRITLGRTWKERMDTAVSELTNTSATIFGTLAIAPAAHWLAQKVSGVPLQVLNRNISAVGGKLTPQIQLARLASALAFMMPFAAMPGANPSFRNWLTLKKHKISSFDNLIGLDPNKQRAKRSYEAELHRQMNRFIGINAIGVGLALASAVGIGLWARHTTAKQLTPVMKWITQTFDMRGAKANQISGLPAFLFWGAPAYVGWLYASRGKSETYEWMLKFANSTVWFFCFGKVVRSLFTNSFNQVLQKAGATGIKPFTNSPAYTDIAQRFTGTLRTQLDHLKNIQYGSGILISTFMMGVTPQLLNIYFTARRHAKEMAMRARFEKCMLETKASVSPSGEAQLPHPMGFFALANQTRAVQFKQNVIPPQVFYPRPTYSR